MSMAFEWDADKAAANALKHGVRFEEAATAFADPLSITIRRPGALRRGEMLHSHWSVDGVPPACGRPP